MITDGISHSKYHLEEYYTDEDGFIELPLRKYNRIAFGYKSINEFLYINLQLREKEDFIKYHSFYEETEEFNLYRPQQEYEAWCIYFLEKNEYSSKYIQDKNTFNGIISRRLYPEDGKLIIYLNKTDDQIGN